MNEKLKAYTKSLRCDIFSSRKTATEAYAYAEAVAKASDNAAAVMTAVQVMVNTICNDIDNINEEVK